MSVETEDEPEHYVPAAGRAWLTRSYDRAVAVSMREGAWRPALVEAVAHDLPMCGTAVEVGCGTGSLTIALAAARPDATVIGVDGDPAVLAIARRKVGAEYVTWQQGLAGSFLLQAAGADVALCSLLLHHLTDDAKAAALEHIFDVLGERGVLHVADWGPPRGPASKLGARALQVLDGRAGPQSLLEGELPAMFTAAGFAGRAARQRCEPSGARWSSGALTADVSPGAIGPAVGYRSR
ncbi:MAG: class I SAM-dependent methyltransferase [Mycobacteriales bacterium]